jgi:hypothetical protein
MLKLLYILIAIAGLIVTASGAIAAPVNKCVVNGAVTYQQGQCASEEARKPPPTLQELNAGEKRRREAAAAPTPSDKAPPAAARSSSSFSCDGRKYCSAMKSCAEAKYFLANCPGVKMDGDGNGVPCEQQWCTR